MKTCYRQHRFNEDGRRRIEFCEAIIEAYQAQGLRLTLRQLYYQLVTKNVIANTEREYQKLSCLVSDARLAGLLDWDAIEDRVRQPRRPSEFDDLADLAEAALAAYRLPRWKGQEDYVELWVEKDALAGVLAPLASKFHVTLLVNRGYSSQSAMYESAKRFNQFHPGSMSQKKLLFYLGDHDPSGEDMVRDIEDRLAMFGVHDLAVLKLALTMEQIRRYKPPPNPAKLTDPRAQKYIEEHGESSWEVDALPPEVLTRIITTAFEEVIDAKKMDAVKLREEQDKKLLRAAVAKLGAKPC